MDLKNHCLFCLEQTVPYIVPPISDREDACGGVTGEGEEILQLDFQSLCTYLKISLPKKENEKSVLSSSCDKFLCISCYEMVDHLSKLHVELSEVRKRIGRASSRIREVILAHDISSDLSSSNKMRLEFEKKLGSSGIGGREDNACLQFVEMFQTGVKGLGLEGSQDGARFTETANISTSKEYQKKVVYSEVELKVEMDEDDLGNCDGDPGSPFSNFHPDMVGSKLANDLFDESSMEGECEQPDDEDVKPDIMAQKTRKKKYKKREWQSPNETNSISCRLRKKLSRETSPEPKPKYKCSDCERFFTSVGKRFTHQRKSHPRKLSTFQTLVASIPQVALNIKNKARRTYICSICGQHVNENRPTRLLNYMEHMLSHDDQTNPEKTRPHSCTDCDKQFNLKINLDLHVVCIHDTRQQFIRCYVCTENVIYGTGEELIAHLKSAHGDTIYSCKHCPVSFVSFEKLFTHMLKHKACKRLLCPEPDCLAVCATMKDLHQHFHQVHPQLKQTFNCERCDNVYLARGTLLGHMRLEHGFNRKSKTFEQELVTNLTCLQCKSKGKTRIYKTKAALHKHTWAAHEKEKTFKCDQCKDKFFVSKHHLEQHIQTNHEKFRFRHVCPHCPKLFMRTKSLNDHIKTHTGEGLLICEVCSKGYSTTHVLNIHMNSHATADTDKRVCEECGKEFPNEYRLNEHKKRIHPKKKKVIPNCPICGRTFMHAKNLKGHIERHSGQRPYQCTICKSCFNQKSSLKTHLKTVHGMSSAEAEEKLKQEAAQTQ